MKSWSELADELALRRLQAELRDVAYSCGSSGHFIYVTGSTFTEFKKVEKALGSGVHPRLFETFEQYIKNLRLLIKGNLEIPVKKEEPIERVACF